MSFQSPFNRIEWIKKKLISPFSFLFCVFYLQDSWSCDMWKYLLWPWYETSWTKKHISLSKRKHIILILLLTFECSFVSITKATTATVTLKKNGIVLSNGNVESKVRIRKTLLLFFFFFLIENVDVPDVINITNQTMAMFNRNDVISQLVKPTHTLFCNRK